MKIKTPKGQVKQVWTDEERRIAASMAGKYPIQVIAEKVNKTPRGVVNQLTRLGFSIKHPDNVKVR